MTEYKASVFIMVRDCIYAIFAGAALYFIVGAITNNALYGGIGAAVGFLIVFLSAIGAISFRVVVDNDNVIVYKGSKEKKRFDRKTCAFGYHIRTTDGDSNCRMKVNTPDGEDTVDCSALGKSRFLTMMNTIVVDEVTPVETTVVETTKSNEQM